MIVAKTPLRMSFFGGGTDFPAYYEQGALGYGTVLSTAINMYTYIMVCHRFDNKIRVCYRDQELVDSVDEVKHDIIREAMKITGIVGSIDVVYSADIPISTAGVGLASSSSMAVGVLNAFSAFQGSYITPSRLAELACDIEINRLINPIGIQDQYAVAHGGFRQYKFHRNGSVTFDMVACSQATLEQLRSRLMLFYTGTKRRASEILSEQKSNISDRRAILDEMAEMTTAAYTELSNGNCDSWGRLLDHAWQLKRRLASKISNPDLDAMYAAAQQSGAIGGKILGAGGGGFLLLYVPEARQATVRSALHEYREIDFAFAPVGSRIVFSE